MSGPSTRKSHPQVRQANRWKLPSTIAWTISGTRGPLRLTAIDSTLVVPHAGQATDRSRKIDMRVTASFPIELLVPWHHQCPAGHASRAMDDRTDFRAAPLPGREAGRAGP